MSALRWVLRIGRSGRSRLVLAVVLGALASGAAVGLTAVSAWLITRASERPPVLHLMVAIVAVRAFGVGRGVLRYLERLTGHESSFRTLGDLRVATVERLERIVPARSTRHGLADDPLRSGELLARFVGDVDGLQDLWVRVVLPYGAAAIVGAGSVVLVAVLVPAAGLVLAATLVATAVVAPVVSVRVARGASARVAPLRAEHQSAVLDLLAGATELAVYDGLDARLDALTEIDRAMTRAEMRDAWAAGLGGALAALAAGAAMWAGLWLGSGAVEDRHLAAVGLAVVVLVPLAIHEVVGGLTAAAHALPRLAASAGRVREIFELPDAASEPLRAAPLPVGPYGLRVHGLCARWSDELPDVLRGVDFELAPGTCTVVTGASGSGKSTLAAVLLRLLDPSGGRAELVGADVTIELGQLAGDDVRSVIGWCAQDAYVFDSTVAANLLLARPDATTELLLDALRQARLLGWVASLPDGLHTLVGEHGSRLSGGQRQRLALARVLLADRPVVVFDEPTEHLDEPTAAALAADLVDTTRGRTVLILTHRPELFPDVPHIALGGGATLMSA
ncbi:MAG: thiol reductant ABC exporter subunit CydC [Actinobacteria bacterium]|nr:thiol reductant ABC exporter subunit CydC [Actinomycetota bacterium]